MSNQSTVKEKAFKQISFSRDFVTEVTMLAEAADRSAAKHIEHCVRIAHAIEQILPSGTVQALKVGSMPAPELLAGLAAVLTDPGQSTVLRGVMSANPVRISRDPATPDGYIRFNADGSRTTGELDDQGEFVERSLIRQRAKGDPTNGIPETTERRRSGKQAAPAAPDQRDRKAVSTT